MFETKCLMFFSQLVSTMKGRRCDYSIHNYEFVGHCLGISQFEQIIISVCAVDLKFRQVNKRGGFSLWKLFLEPLG